VQTDGNKAGYVGDIRHDNRANFVRYLPKGLKVDSSWVGACANNNHFGFMLFCLIFDFIEIYSFRFSVHTVRNDIVEPS